MPSRSRGLQKQLVRQALWDRLRTAPWNPLDDIRAFGSGRPRIQLVHLPSFSPPCFWEVCQRESEWLLYTATIVNANWCALTVQGYELVAFESVRLKAYFDRHTSLTLPVSPDLGGMAGADGTVTQLALFGDLWSQVRYQWWSEPPSGWAPLVAIADEMFEAFGGLPAKG